MKSKDCWLVITDHPALFALLIGEFRLSSLNISKTGLYDLSTKRLWFSLNCLINLESPEPMRYLVSIANPLATKSQGSSVVPLLSGTTRKYKLQ